MQYLRKIKENIASRAYYEAVLGTPLGASFRYYFKMAAWLALFYTAFVSVFFIPNFVNLSRRVAADFAAAYPADLQIVIEGGRASSSLPTPLAIPLPEQDREFFNLATPKGEPQIANLLVIDTEATATPESYAPYRALFVLRGDSFIARDAEGGYASSTLPGDGRLVVDRSFVDSAAGKLNKFLFLLGPLAVLLAYILSFLFFAFALLLLLVVALAALALLRVGRRRVSYRQALAVSLHASTLYFVASFLVFAFYPSFAVNFPFLLALSLLVIYQTLIRPAKPVLEMPKPPAEVSRDTVMGEKETPSAAPAPASPEEVQKNGETSNK